MKNYYKDRVYKVNRLANELDALYHQAARKLGISDSALCILYTVHEKGDGCLLHDVCRDSGISKQTINSAIRNLEKDGVLYLEQDRGKAKRILLTEKGKEYITQTAVRLFEAECNAFASWSDEEFELFFKLNEKYNRSLETEIEKIKGQEE